MGIEKTFEDYSDWPEHLKPVVLERVPSTPEEVIQMVMELKGSTVTTAAIQNTMHVYGVTGGITARMGEEEKAARIFYRLRENGIDTVHRGQAQIILYNIAVKMPDEQTNEAVAEGLFEGRQEMSLRELFDKAGIPHRRQISTGYNIQKTAKLAGLLKGAPETIPSRVLQRKYGVTKLSTRPANRRNSPYLIEAPKVYH
ncbi:TPA: hypothetical protein HA265_05180 [Candidatus Woesearchaeota archaeon]|nr:hypothetical protein [Candidatus Woesearchaeota archaeon]